MTSFASGGACAGGDRSPVVSSFVLAWVGLLSPFGDHTRVRNGGGERFVRHVLTDVNIVLRGA